MRRLGELGLLGVTVPAALGGSEAGPVALALAIREVARADASVAVTMSVTNMVAEIIARCATDDARRVHLPRLCGGDAIAGAFALSEAQAGSDPRAMTTTVDARPAVTSFAATSCGRRRVTGPASSSSPPATVHRWAGRGSPPSCWGRRRRD